ncbi:MAG: class I SAM-dependent methyltransferase [Gemmatimonadetes bacterium]|nr:class I SAM-dependent methyltransferase [Gemmatimonadota bacterium]
MPLSEMVQEPTIAQVDFESVTEVGGEEVTVEQVQRMARRYYWAARYAVNKDVLEVACGSGVGLGHLGTVARSVTAGDLSQPLLHRARRHYGNRFAFLCLDAQRLPFADRAYDVIIIFEALYYVPDAVRFFRECRRVLRPGGTLLISTANKDLFDFNPSPFSYRYLGVGDLQDELDALAFTVTFFGDTPVDSVGLLQRWLRPLKALAARLGLIPKSMRAKRLLKRLVFGGLVSMPVELTSETAPQVPPSRLDNAVPDRVHKVIFASAVFSNEQTNLAHIPQDAT